MPALLTLTVLLLPVSAWSASFTVSGIRDHAVLQQGRAHHLHGTTGAGIAVRAEAFGVAVSTVTDAEGRWSLVIPAQRPSATGTTIVLSSAGIEQRIEDIIVGEVWLCAGQSNMEMRLGAYPEAAARMWKPGGFPAIRYSHLTERNPGPDHRDLRWRTPTSAEEFHGAGALSLAFAIALQEELGQPIGLIGRAVGGSPAAPWIPAGSHPDHPQTGNFYSKMVEPLEGTPIRGVFWDQGEHGSGLKRTSWADAMTQLIPAWRQAWGPEQTAMPWIYMQKHQGAAGYPAVAAQVPDCFMIPVAGLGTGVHPIDKDAYGARAAAIALKAVYGQNP
jgi:sialate O-acetylesterase